MIDQRMKKLADILVTYSVKIKPGEKVLVEAFDLQSEMISLLVNRITEAGGLPFVNTYQSRVMRSLLMNATEEQMKLLGHRDFEFMKQMNAYIGIRGNHNITEYSDVPDKKLKTYQTHWQKPQLDQRVRHSKWVVLRWPNASMAQLAQMSTEQFENFYFDVCTLNYSKMAEAVKPLKVRMESTDRVRLKGPADTDLTFSIKGIPAIPCCGELNIPDGEIFTAPVKDSVNGVIHFNAGTICNGRSFDDIRLEFKNGKIIKATGSDTKALNEILDTDEGARYVGEFAIGFNPYVKKAMRDILFDEKIMGSIHFTPGQAYDEADNGNRSKIHWDMVMIQTAEHGGGEIWFDNELVRKDGMFVPDQLKQLNPENLV